MLKNILKIGGTQVLSKDDQKKIYGAYSGLCCRPGNHTDCGPNGHCLHLSCPQGGSGERVCIHWLNP